MQDDGYFDERVAARYDEDVADMSTPGVVGPMVDLLADLAGGGRALEFGIGNGRIALPLAERGVPVHGIELSKAMVAKLRPKPGAERIGVTIGDFSTTRVEGSFALVYLLFNTIMNLTTQEAQVACFQNAAAHLEPAGCCVVEVGVPDLQRLPPGRDLPSPRGEGELLGDRRVRRRDPRPLVASPQDRRWAGRALLRAIPLRVALGARPDGTDGWDEVARALERMEPRAVHERQRPARVGLGEAAS